MAHDQFITTLHAQSFLLMRQVKAPKFHAISNSVFSSLVTRQLLKTSDALISISVSKLVLYYIKFIKHISNLKHILDLKIGCWNVGKFRYRCITTLNKSRILILVFICDFQVSHCLNEIMELCLSFCTLLSRAHSEMSERELNQIQNIKKVKPHEVPGGGTLPPTQPSPLL